MTIPQSEITARLNLSLNLRQRLGLAFGVMFLFVLATTATGLWYADAARQELALSNASSTQVEALSRTRFTWLEIGSTIDTVLRARRPTLRTSILTAKTERFERELTALPLQNAVMRAANPDGQSLYGQSIRDLQSIGFSLSEKVIELRNLAEESRWMEAELLYWHELIPLQNEFQRSSRRLISSTQADIDALLENAERTRNRARLNWILVSGLTLVAGLTMAFYLGRSIARPIDSLSQSARRVSAGDFSPVVPLGRADEIGALSRSFSAMTDRLRSSYETLEQKVADRTHALEERGRQIQTAARIAAELARPAEHRDLDHLLENAVNLIQSELDFYHAGIFLLDDRGEYAVLRAATGEAGRRMMQNGHKLAVGETGVVGYVAEHGTARIAQNVEIDAAHYRNPLLPDTRSEIALPVKPGSRLIGVLDVQSTAANAFSQEDIIVLQVVADQLATTIENTQLVEELKNTLREQQTLYRQFSQQAWQQVPSMLEDHGAGMTGFHYDRFSGAKALFSNSLELAEPLESPGRLQLPLIVRGVEIGTLDVWPAESEQGPQPFSEQEQQLLERLSSRLSQALESARLFEETQLRMAREQTINQVSASFSRSLKMDDLLRTAVEELRRITPALEVAVHVGPSLIEETDPANNGSRTNGKNGSNHA